MMHHFPIIDPQAVWREIEIEQRTNLIGFVAAVFICLICLIRVGVQDSHSPQVGNLERGGADMLREATMRGLETACSRLPPHGDPTKGPVLDRDLLNKVVAKVECFCADGASDEQVAGRELASGLLLSGDHVKALEGVLHQGLPNLKVV
jgi:hypothetical protein